MKIWKEKRFIKKEKRKIMKMIVIRLNLLVIWMNVKELNYVLKGKNL